MRTALEQTFLGKTLLQTFLASAQGFMDGGGRGGQPALQNLQREADILFPLIITIREPFGAVHFLPDIGCHREVKSRLFRRQLVLHGIGAAFREQRRSIEFQ